ncbi:putative peptidase [Mesocricetibacter intestinalis]|uniref:Putative peptidase n=1 Tax=Mesocricetibacter intestinalis TaxID=1521930 RepID=A0A4R6VBW3_9PAST|nr:phospholipase [Mesocricetibacter intestinalis]TDQ59386.1 putative peptidase [Mesocricetibacter intestinalis]
MRKWIFLYLFLPALSAVGEISADSPQIPAWVGVTLLSEVTEQGQRINAVALEYESDVLSGSNLGHLYRVATSLDQQGQEPRSVLKAYVNDKAETAYQAKTGRFVIIELDSRDNNAALYSLRKENERPMKFRARDSDGKIIEIEKVQRNNVPKFYHARLQYHIEQKGLLKLSNGKTLDGFIVSQSAAKNKVKNRYIDNFIAHQVASGDPHNILRYRLYTPTGSAKSYPLLLFLHGSGQVGSDNLAQLLSSKGATFTLAYEQGFVLAPQYSSVFDPFDDANKGQRGGIHWQSDNRMDLVLQMLDRTLAKNPTIDKRRIYLVGLSRGAEGALKLLQKRPHFFAGALLISGREADSLEWIDGNATPASLAPLKNVPIWFFHSKQDQVAPVQGSRINYRILSALGAPYVKYTEFSFIRAGDNGIINHNPHNSWDAVFNSPEVITWLLAQRLP